MNFSLASSRLFLSECLTKKWIKLYVSIYSVSPALCIWVNSDDRPSIQSIIVTWRSVQLFRETYIPLLDEPLSYFLVLWPSPLKRMRKRGLVTLCTTSCPKLWNVARPIRSLRLQLMCKAHNLIFTKNAAQMCHMVAFVSTRALWRLWAGKRHRVSPAITSPWY